MQYLEKFHNELKQFIANLFAKVEQIEIKAKMKAGAEIVTNIDLFVEKEIIGFIRKHYPDNHILSEEFFPENITNGRFWTIDPLDGTANFASNLPLYCVQIALIEEGTVLYSFIYIPETKSLFHAFKDGGAFLNGKKISKTLIAQLPNNLFSVVGFSSKKATAINIQKVIKFAKDNKMKIRMLGSAGIELALIARGSFAILYSNVNNLWDIAPGYLLACETGCVIKNGQGLDYQLGDNEIIVYNNEKLANEAKLHCLQTRQNKVKK